ncbi:hypothetical protein Pla52nx_001785 [Stieleria varia]|uniref:hypothetical protein n=1 Tax=Stieleria varia TaxID=2528005 RepID=UPI00313E2CBB
MSAAQNIREWTLTLLRKNRRSVRLSQNSRKFPSPFQVRRTLWKQSHPESDDPTELDSQSPLEESTTKEPHDYRCKKCNGLVDPAGQLEGSLTVSLLAVAHWVVTWQQAQATTTQVVPHWRRALAAVIGQRISMPSKNAFINGMRSGLIQPDAHWLSLIEQAIELVSEEVEWPEATARPP